MDDIIEQIYLSSNSSTHSFSGESLDWNSDYYIQIFALSNDENIGQPSSIEMIILPPEPGSDERRQALIDNGYEKQIQKLPESMRSAYRERIVQLDDPEQIHQAMLDGVLDAADEDPRAIVDFMAWSIIGTNPPEGLGSFLYQNAGNVTNIPMPGSEAGEKLVSRITELYKSGRIRKSEDPKKGPFLMYVDEDGKERPLMKTRTKKTKDGDIERTYIEKGGTRSVLFKLLSGELG